MLMQLIQFQGYDGKPFFADENGKLIPEVLINAQGQPEQVFRDGNAEEEAQLMELFRETDLSDEFEQKYGFATRDANGLSNSGLLNLILEKLYGRNPKITLSRFIDAVRTGIDAGSFARKPAPAPAAPRSRDEAGRFANTLDEEVRRLAATNPGEIKNRARTDRDFAAAVDRVMFPKAPVAPSALKDANNEEAILFARAYRRTGNLKPVGGVHTLDYGNGEHREFTVDAFRQRVDEAIECGAL